MAEPGSTELQDLREPAGAPALDRIRVTGISATGYHGYFEHERRTGQTFVADVVLHVDTRQAAATDRLDLTTDYGVLAEQVAAVLTGEPADLIETVAERIAVVALGHAGVQAVDVVLHKPQAPVTVPFSDVSVEIHRSVQHPPSLVAASRAEAPVDAVAHEVPARPAGPETGATALLPAVAPLPPEPAGVPEVPTPLDALDAPLATPTWEPWDPPAADEGHATVVLGMLGLDALEHGGPDGGHGRPDRLDAVPAQPVDVVLALGSNLGASQDTLRRAVAELAAVPGLEVTVVAPLARTGSVGGPEQPDYLNTVVLGRTVLSPRALLRACQGIENAHGRVREERWAARTLDIDLIVHGSTVAAADDLEVPHPRANQRAFVLEPWAQVAPDAVLPGLGGGPVAALAQTAPDRGGIRWLALDWWSAPEVGP